MKHALDLIFKCVYYLRGSFWGFITGNVIADRFTSILLYFRTSSRPVSTIIVLITISTSDQLD